MTADLLAALALPCRFHDDGESRLPSGAQSRQGRARSGSGGPMRRTMVPKMRPARRKATLRLELQGA